MNAHLAAIAISAVVFSGGIVGLLLHRILPPHHLTRETREVVLLGTGMLSVIAALVLGLLIATARDTLSTADAAVRGFSTELIQADQTLRSYGPETDAIRRLLRSYAMTAAHDDWAQPGRDLLDATRPAEATLEQVRRLVLALEPTTPAQHWLRDKALGSTDTLLKSRWQLLEEEGLAIHPAFLLILTGWVTIIFASFGFNAPRNATIVAAFFICAASVGASVFLILEMETPFMGVIQASSRPLEIAVARMGQ